MTEISLNEREPISTANVTNADLDVDPGGLTGQNTGHPGVDPDQLPHRVRYDSPKADRRSKAIYMGDRDAEFLTECYAKADRQFDEEVYRTDVYLAALRACRDWSDVRAELEMMGYGFRD